MLAFERAAPRFDGALTLARPAGAVLASGKAVAYEPWRLTSKVKADASTAALEEVSFQYGPDERAVTLAGSAEFKFGAQPQLQGDAVGAADRSRPAAGRRPMRRGACRSPAVQAFGEMLGGALRPSWPVQACDQRRRGDARRRHLAECRRASCDRTAGPGRSTSSNSARRVSRQIKLHGGLYPRRQGAWLRRRRQHRFQRSEESGGLAHRTRRHGRADQAVARQGRCHARRRSDRGRAAADRVRPRRGRGQRGLRVARRQSAGAARSRSPRGRARSRRGVRLRRVGVVRTGAGVAARGHARARHRPCPDRRLRGAQRRGAPHARRQRTRDRAALDRRFRRCQRRGQRPDSDRGRRRAATSRSISTRAISAASSRCRKNSRRALAEPLRRLASRQKTAMLRATVSLGEQRQRRAPTASSA